MRTLFSYGSTLSPHLRKPDSRPDWFMLVDNLPRALLELGHPHLAAIAEALIPPITISHLGGKLSLLTWAQAERELEVRDDLYLAGRLSKKLQVHCGDPTPLVERAVATVIEAATLDLPRVIPLDEAILRCLHISYRAEVRPEGPEKSRALFEAFPAFYRAQFGPRLEAHARSRGITVRRGRLCDQRPHEVRLRERAELHTWLRHSRLRSLLRWPQQLLVFRGSIPYVLGKLRRTIG